MKSFFTRGVLVIALILMLAPCCFATGEVPVPKQEILYENTGPHNELVGKWAGNLKLSIYSQAYAPNWDFSLYVISINEEKAKGIYCWAGDKGKPGCQKVEGTMYPAEGKLVFHWGERVITLNRTGKVTFQKSGGVPFEGLATKVEK